MFRIEKNERGVLEKMFLTKGDTTYFTLSIINPTSLERYDIRNGERAILRIKKYHYEEEYKLEKNGILDLDNNVFQFEIQGSDTLNMKLGDYLLFVDFYGLDFHNTIVVPNCENNTKYTPNFVLCVGR